MYVELKNKWEIRTGNRMLVVFDFDDLGEAAQFVKPFISETKGPVIIDLSDKGDVSICYEPKNVR